MNLKEFVPELIFIRNGNAPSSKTFTLKLNDYSVITNLILESQNNLFPSTLNIEFKDFLNNTVNLHAREVSNEGNIQRWELDPVLTGEIKVLIEDDEASIINVTPIIVNGKKYYKNEDVDTRIKSEEVTIITENQNKECYFTLQESRIIDRIQFLPNGDFELFYSSGDNQNFVKITTERDESSGTYKFLPVMMKRIYIKSNNSLTINFLENTNIFIFNYISYEIDSLFTDNTFSALKDEVTYNDIKDINTRVHSTEEYISKLNLAKKLLTGKEDGKTMIYRNEQFEMWKEFFLNDNLSHGYIEIEYADNYGNIFTKVPLSIDGNKITFKPFFAKDITFKIYGASQENLIITGTPFKEDYYSEIDEDTRIDKSTITATSGCGHYAHLVAQRAVDGDESTQFHSNPFTSIGYGDVYFSFSQEKVIDRVHVLTRPNSLGRIQNYTLFYKESSEDEWMEVAQCLMDGISGNWRNVHFKPVLAKELCVRVTKGNEDHVLIYETEFFKYNRLYDILMECFTDESKTALVDKVDLSYLKYLRTLLAETVEYNNIYKEIENLYLESIEPNIFKATNLTTFSVITGLQFSALENILRADVRYFDKNKKEFRLKNIEINNLEENKKIINFTETYTDNFELLIYGTYEIYGVEAISENIENYSFNTDVDITYNNENFTIDYYAIDEVIYNIIKLSEKKLISKFATTFEDRFSIYCENSLTKDRYLYNENNQFNSKIDPMFVSELFIKTATRRIKKEELKIFIHSFLEDDINNLFTDETYTSLKTEITFENILELEKRVLITKDYMNKIQLAKDLFKEKVAYQDINYTNNDLRVINHITLKLKNNLNTLYGVELNYIDSLGNDRSLKTIKYTSKENELDLTFDPIYTKDFTIRVFLEEIEKWKPHYLEIIPCIQSNYYVTNDIFTEIPQNTIKGISRCGSHKPIENALDGNLETNFYGTSIGDVEFIFERPKVVDQFRYVCKSTNGNIKKGEIYYKETSNDQWRFATTFSISNSANSNIKILEIPPVLAKEIMIRTLESSSNSVSLYEVNFKIYNPIHSRIKDIFNNDFTKVNPGIGIKDIEEIEKYVTKDKELIVALELAKVFINNNGNNPFDILSIKPLEKNTNFYFGKINANSTGNLYITPHYLKPNQDYIFVFNRAISGTLTTFVGKPNPNCNFNFKPGINIINPGEQQGQLFLQGSRETEIRMYTLSELDNGLVYRYGYDSYKEFYQKSKIESVMSENHNCNLAYIEGVNTIAAFDIDWLKSNIKPEEFLEVLKTRDEYVDFLYNLVGANKAFDEPIPYKRIMWTGLNSDNPHAGVGTGNGYTAYSGNPLAFNHLTKERYAHHWVVGHEVGHELDNNGYLMGIFGEVFNNWFAESGLLEYKHGGGWSNDNIITNEAISIYDADFWGKLAFWFKMRYFYNDREFIIKMNEYMQANPTTSNEDAASKLAMFTSDILNRDTSDYFLRHSFPISQEAIDVCKTYPPFAIPIWQINWTNKDEFIAEENRLFLEKLTTR
ncbi:MAG: discoidin domain-containing protein [Cetobacterium sp.]|uniref:discoidin domain-containing protein n=1 Tax=Cetobacterium sp. TaxID=2071632 RepID=UPI003EE7F044